MTDDTSLRPPGVQPQSGIDSSVPHSARIWNYWLGGRDNYPVDREAAEQFGRFYPGIVEVARSSREFLIRAVRYLAADVGIRQFLDIGTGLPAADNTHEVAQRVAPESRIVYVDNDPLVLAHARALLTSSPQGKTAYVDADLRDPGAILDAAGRTLDFARPTALIFSGILGHITDTDEAYAIVNRLLDALPSGSYLSLNEGANTDKAYEEAQRHYNESGAVPYHLRTPEQIARFFDGLEFVEPGVVSCPLWRPEADPVGAPTEVGQFGGVGRKL